MNRSEYNKCVELYADGIFRFALSNLCQREKAEDVVQETFARMWERVENVAWKSAKSYLFATAYHLMIDEIRYAKRLEAYDETHAAAMEKKGNAVCNAGYPDVQEILHKALNALPEIQRSLILLRDYEGYSYQEIGTMTGLSESQVKVYIFRGRTALKKQLKSIDNLIDVAP